MSCKGASGSFAKTFGVNVTCQALYASAMQRVEGYGKCKVQSLITL
jgi:hypothetical protein